MDKRPQSGFTLYELMIAVLIVGVVLTFAIPNMQDFTRNSRMSSAANDLHSTFHLARSESSRAKTNITICPSTDTLSCGGNWDDGYIVFVDLDGDLSVDGGDGESVLRAQGAMHDALSLAIADNGTYFSFASTGLGRTGVGGNTAVSQIVICDERGTGIAAGGSSAARLFVVTPLGRATIVREKETIDDALSLMDRTCP
ncbi:MAG: GspH/FimT family pseudopilin [Gammaproteobacteria bacterium]|nr:GspH/FimT family pseudopilin [Gammaproteobacteria bacterium]MBT8106282.1 GspH/FimT family pseudopilin [Gammaproteobacteria bacterium]NNF48686.1 prepilin-type N-terminal cleavage/methylation domain-containing protein [Woeseiaceae bacterium]NNK26296.1 prepilin-type N-terminal cleavage/methylation domain-containing protein [Woeseiaceae bacterium]NNL63549.1 prepilin-type N-terminal cleavage/methylation domain-containing protein [Woeseiaceae bacterium]